MCTNECSQFSQKSPVKPVPVQLQRDNAGSSHLPPFRHMYPPHSSCQSIKRCKKSNHNSASNILKTNFEEIKFAQFSISFKYFTSLTEFIQHCKPYLHIHRSHHENQFHCNHMVFALTLDMFHCACRLLLMCMQYLQLEWYEI